jgi:hypothetical protein
MKQKWSLYRIMYQLCLVLTSRNENIQFNKPSQLRIGLAVTPLTILLMQGLKR